MEKPTEYYRKKCAEWAKMLGLKGGWRAGEQSLFPIKSTKRRIAEKENRKPGTGSFGPGR